MPATKIEKELREQVEALRKENTELRAIRDDYRQFLENLNEVLYVLDHNAAITYISPNIQRLSGYEPYEIIGRHFTDFVHPEDLANRIENFQAVFYGGDLVTEYRYIIKSGASVWIRTHGRGIIRDGRFAGVQGMLVDISDLKEAQAALMRSEQKFRELFEHSPDAVFIHELNGRTLEVNEVACKQTGYSREELMQITPIDIVVLREAPEVLRRIETAAREGRLTFETVHRRKDGIEYPAEVKIRRIEYEGTPAILGVARDIMERKTRESMLRESERQKDMILNSAAERIIYFDTDFRIIWANRLAAEMADKTENDMAGRYCYEMFHQRSRPCPDCIVEKAKNTGLAQYAEKGAGDKFWFQRAYPTIDDAGKVGAVVMFAQDITEQKQAELKKAHLEEQFRQAQKLESVGRLAGGVAHDINNLLSPVLGYGEMLRASTGMSDDQKQKLDHMVEAGKRARAMVRQLLAFSRQQKLEFKAFDLNALIINFEPLLRYTLMENITLNIKLADKLPFINGDAGQVEQIVLNLAVNAQDAMPQGGELSIETTAAELDESYAKQRNGISPGTYVILTVSDTGEGMSAEVAERIFEPFFTTKGKDKGTGLGLSTAYGIVKQHGGNIWAYSEVGLGTTFRAYLPVFQGEVIQTVDSDPKMDTAAKPNSPITVLVAEDEDFVRGLVVSMLESFGCKALSGKSGNEVIMSLNQHNGTVVDLLITDVVMPDMSGKDLHDQVSGIFPNIKTIFMSGYAENVIASHGVLALDANFLQKPFSAEDLAAKIRDVLNK